MKKRRLSFSMFGIHFACVGQVWPDPAAERSARVANPAPDGGNPAPDGGNPATDGGNLATDGGNPATDGGNLATDGGNPATDGGNPEAADMKVESSAPDDQAKLVKGVTDDSESDVIIHNKVEKQEDVEEREPTEEVPSSTTSPAEETGSVKSASRSRSRGHNKVKREDY